MVKHIVPNAIGTIIVQATFAVADSILTLSVLGFLTLGVAPPATDWGSMLSGGLQLHPGRQLLVADLPAGHRDHLDLHRVQLHR